MSVLKRKDDDFNEEDVSPFQNVKKQLVLREYVTHELPMIFSHMTSKSLSSSHSMIMIDTLHSTQHMYMYMSAAMKILTQQNACFVLLRSHSTILPYP